MRHGNPAVSLAWSYGRRRKFLPVVFNAMVRSTSPCTYLETWKPSWKLALEPFVFPNDL